MVSHQSIFLEWHSLECSLFLLMVGGSSVYCIVLLCGAA